MARSDVAKKVTTRLAFAVQCDSDGLGDKRPIWLLTFHALAWAPRDCGKRAVIVELTRDCAGLDDLVRSIVTIDGVRYVCLSLRLDEQAAPPYHEGQLVELVVTEF